jgi:hypothetical protein
MRFRCSVNLDSRHFLSPSTSFEVLKIGKDDEKDMKYSTKLSIFKRRV